MPTRKPPHQKGFTLLEAVMTIFISTFLMAAVTTLFINLFKTSRQQSIVIDTVDQARKVVFNFASELRAATIGNEGAYPLNLASTTEIIVYTASGAQGQNINRVRYFLNNSVLYKGIVIPSGNPLTYNIGTEKITVVQRGVANGNTPLFYYYDGNYGGTTTPLAQPVNINQVRFVKINMVLLKQEVRNSASTYTITAGGAIRNLKSNLGN